MSHSQLEAYTRSDEVADFAAVVVYSRDKDMPYIEDTPYIRDLLLEQFDDVDDPDHGMSAEQAENIAAFVQKQENDDVDIIVSCQYGQSRSAGIAAAIAAYLGQDEMKIFSNSNKMPNMRCYALVCQALGIERSEEEIRERFLINANA